MGKLQDSSERSAALFVVPVAGTAGLRSSGFVDRLPVKEEMLFSNGAPNVHALVNV